jgi:alpha-L-fucosidase
MLKADFALGARAESATRRGGAARFAAAALTDGKRDTYWVGEDGDRTPEAVIALKAPATVDVVRLREFTPLGQRVEAFALDAWLDGEWREVAAATTVGHQRVLRFPAVTADRFRLRVISALAAPCLSELSLFKEPAGARGPEAVAARRKPVGWKLVASTNQGRGAPAERAFDGDPATFWHTHPDAGELPPPQSFAVDTGRERAAKGFFYIPRQDGTRHGMTDRYRFEGSLDGATWTTLAEGEFGNLRANPQEQAVTFAQPARLRYFRFTGLRALEKSHVTAAEVGLIE